MLRSITQLLCAAVSSDIPRFCTFSAIDTVHERDASAHAALQRRSHTPTHIHVAHKFRRRPSESHICSNTCLTHMFANSAAFHSGCLSHRKSVCSPTGASAPLLCTRSSHGTTLMIVTKTHVEIPALACSENMARLPLSRQITFRHMHTADGSDDASFTHKLLGSPRRRSHAALCGGIPMSHCSL